MKKALAIFMVLAVATGVAFADVADIAVSGFGKLSWGVALDGSQPNGFKNSSEWKIVLPLLAKKTFTTKGEGANYAEISIVDAQYGIEGKHDATGFTAGDKKIDKVSAKLVFGAVYMTVTGAPGFKTNNAEIWAPIKNDGYFDDGKEGKALRFEPGFDGAGTKIGYKTDKFDVGVKLASQLGWERDAAVAGSTTYVLAVAPVGGFTTSDDNTTVFTNTVPPVLVGDSVLIPEGTTYLVASTAAAKAAATNKSQYAFGFDATVTPSDMVTASATFNYATWNGVAIAEGNKVVEGIMSAGFKVTAKPVADLDLLAALDAGNNYTVNADSNDATLAEQVWAYDALVSAKYKKLVEAGMYYASAGTPFAAGSLDAEKAPKFQSPIADMAVYAKVMDGGLVPNLTASATVMALQVLNTDYYLDGADQKKDANPIAFGVDVAYKVAMGDVNYVKPYASVYGQNKYDRASMSYAGGKDGEFATKITVGADYGLFTNTVLNAEFHAGETQDNKATELVKTASRTTKGVFVLSCKVTY